jgi:hypothetical protein
MNAPAFLDGYMPKQAKQDEGPVDSVQTGLDAASTALRYGRQGAKDYGLEGASVGAGIGALGGGLKALLTDDVDEEGNAKKKGIFDYLKSMTGGALMGAAVGGLGAGAYGAGEQGLRGAQIGGTQSVMKQKAKAP